MKNSPFYQTGIPKMPKTGTTDFPTTESRKSNYKLKDLAKAGADIVMSTIPGGGIFKAAKGPVSYTHLTLPTICSV